ncbi:uncharacterized protein LOC135368469 isoform X4 [Ornithodoros turicata]|uniref:uncharacterized protein LOC135368469 isoform X4 n=1 Tax=Ornithodoros turicata TaxID=34597 RepID=UPI00313A3F75
MTQFVTHIPVDIAASSRLHRPQHHVLEHGRGEYTHMSPTHEQHHSRGGHKKTDGSASFLRAARAGNLEKVLEYLKGSIDINTSNANGLNALHLAAKEGHVNVVNELLKRGANVNAATKKGNTALHIASLAGQEEVVKILVAKQANVNVQSQNGFTPLYMAAQENHDNVVRFLLANGANQSLATEDGFTPLAVALQQGHDRVVAVLLENDAKGKVRLPALHIAAKKDDCKAASLLLHSEHNPDVTSKSGFTPLHIAAHYGNSNIASLLLDKGADVNFPAKHQITPLHVAAKWGKINMVKLLLEKGAKLDASTRDGLTPLHCAARSGHDQVVELLLERNAPITAKTKNGLAPLHMASQGDHVDSARILLYHKAPVDDVTVDYLTALHVAAHCGHVGVAKLLLDRRAEPNARALNGFTPLHIACKKNRIKVVELLLKQGASIEATTESGLTPLHVASFMGCMNIVIYLLQHGANPDIPTVRGETPLHLAARANQTDIIRILLRNGAHVDAKARELQTALHIGARLGNADMVGLLLQHGAAVDAPTKDQYTPLHVAAREGQDEVAALLLDHGASLSASTKKGFTPLHLAAKHGNIKVARLLLQKDAPVDAQGKNGVTPLHVAAHYDHVNVALLLLEKGASPHAAARNGYTPLHVAARKDQMDIASTLLEYGAKPNAESRAGFTPLHLAAQEGHADVATLLVEHGAQCDAKAKNGLTPLHLCAQEDRVNVAAVLAKHGAQIDPNTKAGYTPLHVACHFGQINMIRFLLQHGSNVNATTAHGYTPLHQAAQQGHTLIINLLLEHRASPNATTNQGQTALSIAQRLGYISVVETLKVVTETIVTTTTTTVTEEKYKVVAPETMHETFMSDSEDEADDEHDMGVVSTKLCLSNVKALKSHTTDDNMLGDQSFRYLTADEMKSLGDDSLPIDVTRDERLIESVNVTREAGQIAPLTQEEERLSPTHAHQTEAVFVGNYAPDNIDISRTPVHAGSLLSWDGTGSCSSSFVLTPSKRMWRESSKLRWKTFLVSFLVDARGGAMRGCRHSGVRVIIPPRKAPGPMRITCRYLRKEKLPHPPPLLEGEACASRILEVGPAGAKFLGPVIIEVPHFASLRGKEREITILRSDNGETWKEHTLEASEEAVQEVLNESFEGEELTALEDLHTNRITRILTTDFPQYFAVVTRSRQEVHAIGPEGGLVSSTVVPQVQAIFPEGALTKKIRVGLQAQPIHSDLVTKLLGNRVAVSPIVTVEPRRRKFHKPITLTIPVPQAATKGMINQYSGDAPTLRLLCSITGGVNKAQWEDVTGSTPLTFVNDCVSFTTTVSARFWLMDCRQVNEATRFATELYAEAIHVPFMAKFVVFSKRHDPQEAQLRVFCMTDDKEDKTLETQEHFTEVAKSRDVEVLENKPQYLEFAGNLIPVTKSGEQLSLTFQAFRENRVPFNVRVKDLHQEALGRVAFMKEPRGSRTDPPQTPICNLNIALPEFEASRAVSELVTLEKKYGFVEETGLAKPELIHRADLRLSDIARELGKDWEPLGQQLDIPEADIHSIRAECPGDLAQQALLVLRLWMQRAGPRATGNNLEKGLRRINREDIVNKCMFNVELVTDDVEKAVAKVHLDQSGFDTFREELGTSRNASLKRDTSLNASYDEPDLMKEAESAEETSSETGSVHEKHGSSEAKARKLKKSDTRPRTPSPDTTQVTVIKRSSKEGTPTIALEESFDDPRMENHVLPSERTVITDPTFVVMKELKEPPEASRVPGHDDLITQGELDELVEGVLYPEAKGTEKKQIGPVIVEERELSDAPDSIVKVVSVTKRTVTQLPVTEEVPVQQVGSRLPGIMEGKEQPDVVSTVVTEVEYKSGPEAAGIVSFPTETQERLTHPGTLLPADTSDVRQGDVVITTDPEMMRTVTTTVERFEGEPQELGTTYILSELPDDQTEGTTRVVRTVTREVKGEPSEESVITVQTTTTTSASAPGKQPELSANLLDEMFKDTGKESPYGRILKADEVAKLKSKPGMKKEDLELLDQLFPDQGPSKTAYPPEGLVPENVIIPEYRTFVMAEEPKKPMSPKKKERVLEKIGRALSHDEQEGRQRPRLVRAATVDSATLEESHKEEVQEPPIAMQKVEQSEAKPTVLPAVAESTTPEAAPMEDEPLTKSTEFRTLPSDDAIVTKTTTQFQDVLDDGTVKHTVTTVTRTTIIQEVDEGAPQAEIPSAPPAADVLQQPGAKPGESETWASDLDTSQVSVSSLPEDEKTEPTATLSSATTTAEGASSSEPGVQTQVEEKEWTETDPDSGDVRRVVCKTTHTSVSSAKPTESQQSKDKASDADTQQASDEEESLTFVQKREFFEKLSELSPPKDSRPRLSSTPSLDTTLTRPVATQRPRPRSESLTSQGEIVEESIVFSERLKKFQQNEGALPEQDVFEGFEQAECQLRKVREELEADVLKEAASDSRTRLLEGTSKLAFGQADSRPKPPSEIVGSKTELKLLVRTSEPGKEALDMRLTEYMDTEGRHEEQQQFARVLVRSHDTEGDAYQPKRDDAPSLRASASPIASSPMQPRDFGDVPRDFGAPDSQVDRMESGSGLPLGISSGDVYSTCPLSEPAPGSVSEQLPGDDDFGEGLKQKAQFKMSEPGRTAGPTATLVTSANILQPHLADVLSDKQPQTLDITEHTESSSILERCIEVSKGDMGISSVGKSLMKSDFVEIQDQLTSAFGEEVLVNEPERGAKQDVPRGLFEALDVTEPSFSTRKLEEGTAVPKHAVEEHVSASETVEERLHYAPAVGHDVTTTGEVDVEEPLARPSNLVEQLTELAEDTGADGEPAKSECFESAFDESENISFSSMDEGGTYDIQDNVEELEGYTGMPASVCEESTKIIVESPATSVKDLDDETVLSARKSPVITEVPYSADEDAVSSTIDEGASSPAIEEPFEGKLSMEREDHEYVDTKDFTEETKVKVAGVLKSEMTDSGKEESLQDELNFVHKLEEGLGFSLSSTDEERAALKECKVEVEKLKMGHWMQQEQDEDTALCAVDEGASSPATEEPFERKLCMQREDHEYVDTKDFTEETKLAGVSKSDMTDSGKEESLQDELNFVHKLEEGLGFSLSSRNEEKTALKESKVQLEKLEMSHRMQQEQVVEEPVTPNIIPSPAVDFEAHLLPEQVKDVHSSIVNVLDEMIVSPVLSDRSSEIQGMMGRESSSPEIEPEIRCDSTPPREPMSSRDYQRESSFSSEKAGFQDEAATVEIARFLVEEVQRKAEDVVSSMMPPAEVWSVSGKQRRMSEDVEEDRQELAVAALEWEERLEKAEEHLHSLAQIADRSLAAQTALEQEVEALKEKGIYDHAKFGDTDGLGTSYRGPAHLHHDERIEDTLHAPCYDTMDVSPGDEFPQSSIHDLPSQYISHDRYVENDEFVRDELETEKAAEALASPETSTGPVEKEGTDKREAPVKQQEKYAMDLRETAVLQHVLHGEKMTPDSENFESSGYESLGTIGSPFKTLDKSKACPEKPPTEKHVQAEDDVTADVPGTNTYQVEEGTSKVIEILKPREKVAFDLPESSDDEFDKDINRYKEVELAVPLQQMSSLEDDYEGSFSSGDLQAEKIAEFLTTDTTGSHPVNFPQVFQDNVHAEEIASTYCLHEPSALSSTVSDTPLPGPVAHEVPVEHHTRTSPAKRVGFSMDGERTVVASHRGRELDSLSRETATCIVDEVVHIATSIVESMQESELERSGGHDDHSTSILCQSEELVKDAATVSSVDRTPLTIGSKIPDVSLSMVAEKVSPLDMPETEGICEVESRSMVSPLAQAAMVQSASETSFTASMAPEGPPAVGVKEIYELFKETEEPKERMHYMVELGDIPYVHTDVLEEDDQKRRSSPTAESLDDQAQIEKCSKEVMMQLLDGFSQSDIELAEVRTEDEAPDIEDDMLSPEGSAEERSAPSSREGAKVGAGASESTGSGSSLQSHREVPGTTALEPSYGGATEFQPQSSMEVEIGSQTSGAPPGLSEFESELGTEDVADAQKDGAGTNASLKEETESAVQQGSEEKLGSAERGESWKPAEKAETPEQTTAQPAASPDNVPSFDRNLCRPEKRSPLLEASPPEETDYNMEQEISPAKEYPDYLTPDMQVSVGVSPTEGFPPCERKYSGGDSSEKSPLPAQKNDDVFVPSSEKVPSTVEAHGFGARYSESSLESSADVDSPKIPLSEPVMAFENVAFAGEDIIDASSEPPDELTSPCGTRSPYEVVRETASEASVAALIKHSEEKLQEEVCAQMKQKLLVSAPDEPPSMHMTGVTITQHVVTEIYTEDVGGPPVDKSPAEIKETLKELFPGGTDYLTAGLNVTGIIRSPISHKGNSDDEDGEEEEWADRVLSKIKDRPVPPTPPASPRTVQSAVEVKEQVTWEAPVEEHIEETVEEVKEIPAEEQVIIEHDEDICKDSSSTQEETTDRDASYEESGVQQEATGKDEVRPHHKRPVLEHIPSEISDEDLVEREQSPTGHPPDTCREWKDDFSSRRDSSPDSDSDKGGGGAVAHGGLPSSTAVLVQSTTGRDEEKPSCSTDKQDKTQAAESEAADEGFLTATLAKEVLSTVNEFSTDLRKDNVKDMSRIRDDSSASVGKISPSEQLSSPPEKKSDSDSGKADAPLVILRNKTKVTRKTEKRTSRDLDTQSGSETDQSHYYSFELTSDSGKTPSRPTSSEFDINVLSGHASSEYDTCVTSQDASYATAPTSSQEVSYATARSSLSGSSRESAYSVDSESSGHLGSLEASEASDTIVASAHEDLESDNESQMSSSILREPYDGSISESVIRSGVEVPFLPNWQTSSSSVSPGQHTSYAHRFHQMPGEMTGDGSSSPFEMILQECVGEYSSTAVTRSLELQQDVHGDTGSTTLERGTEDQMVRGDILNGAAGTSDVTRHTRDDRMAMSHEEEPLSISESSATQSELTWQTSVETTVDMGQARRSSCDADRYQRQSTMADSATYSLPRDEAVVVGDLADLQAELDDVADDDATPPFSEINGPVEVDYVPEYDDPYAVRQRERLQQQGQHRAEGDVQEQQEVLAGHDVQVHQEQHESDAEAAERTQDDDEQDQGLEEGYYTETFESNLSTEEVEGAMSREFLIGSKLLLDRPESEVDIILPGAKDSSYDECLAQDIDLLERPMTPEPPEEIHVSEGGEAKGEAASSFTIEPKDSLLTKQGSSDTSPPISESFEFVEKADVMSIPTEGEHFEMVPGLHTESQLAFLVKEMEVKGHEHAVSPSGEVEYSSKCEEYVTHLHQTYDTSPPKDTENEFICEQAMDVENARLIEDKLTDDSSQQDQDFPFDLSYQHDYSDQERGDFGELYTHQEVEEENYDDERARLRSKRLSPVSDERGSTPDYDTLAGRKTFCRGSEKDDASTSSLQEFERLEAEMAAGKSSSVGSSDSFSGRHFNAKSGSEQDSVSVNSLTEFEKLEKDIVEAENVDGRVRSEIATRLDEIDEGHESQASDPGFDFTECRTVDCDQETMDEIEEIIKQARANVAQLEKSSQGRFADVGQTAETEYTSTKDYPASVDGEDLLSVEPPPEMESSKLLLSTELESGRVARHILLGRTMSGQSYDNGERRSSTSTATNFDTDSLVDRDIDGEDSEANPPSETSAWSLKEKSDLDHDSLHGSQSSAPHDSLQENLSRGEEKDSLQEFEQKSGDLDSLQEDNRQDSLHETRDIDMDSMNGDHSRFRVDQADRQSSPIRTTELSPTLTRGVAAPVVVERIDTLCWVEQGSSIPDQGMLTQGDKVRGDIMVSSTDSLEPSSSANTHATYQFETDSVMSSSLNSVQTSCEESTMVSSTDTLDPEPYAQMAYAPPDSASQHLGMDLAMTMKEVGEKLLESPTEFPSEPLGYGLSSELREEIASVKSYVTKEDNATTIRQMKQVVHQEDSRQEKSGGEAPPDIEEQFKDYLRRTMGSPTDKEEVEERKAVDEYGNVTITRMVKRHITSEPQIHAQTFTGSDAEEKTREFLQSFKEIEPSTEKDEYEGFDADGNPIRVTQKVVVRPTVKTVTFSGPNARAQMEEYMRTHSAREMSSAEDTPTSDSGVGACSMSSPPSLTPDPHTCTDLMTTTSAPLASPGLRHLPDGGHWTECEGLDESGQPITTSRVITTRTTRTIGPDGQEQVVTTTTTSMAGEEDSDERMRRSMQGVLENFMRDQGPTHGSYFEENEE